MIGIIIALSMLILPGQSGYAENTSDSQSEAVSRRELALRYRDFLRTVRERQEKNRTDRAAVSELKAQQQAWEAKRELARKAHIQERDAERKAMDSEARDRAIENQAIVEAQKRNIEYHIFSANREKLQNALKGARFVDPHDEFEVGTNYEEGLYETEDESEN